MCSTDKGEAGMPTIFYLNIISVTKIIITRGNNVYFFLSNVSRSPARKDGEAL